MNKGPKSKTVSNRVTMRKKTASASDKISPLVKSERLYLREVRLNDVNDRYYRWMNDIEINRYLESRFQTLSHENLAEFVKKMDSDPDNFFFAICTLDGHEHIGNIKLGPVNWHHRRAEVGLLIGEKDYWGKGIATEAIAMVTRYAFEILCLNKLRAGCYMANEGSARAFEKCGWSREGLLRDDVLLDGAPHDCIMLGITSDDYRRMKKE